MRNTWKKIVSQLGLRDDNKRGKANGFCVHVCLWFVYSKRVLPTREKE